MLLYHNVHIRHTLGLQAVFLYTAELIMDSAPMILEETVAS